MTLMKLTTISRCSKASLTILLERVGDVAYLYLEDDTNTITIEHVKCEACSNWASHMRKSAIDLYEFLEKKGF